MASEIKIQESVCLKLTTESLEETVNKVKQLETSSQVAETVNTPVETGKPTDESGTFFQSLSVPMVTADEHSNTPESHKAAKPEKETVEYEENAIENEVREDDVPEVGSKLFDSVAPSTKEALNVLDKNQGDSDGVTSSQDAACEDITTVADFKEQDLSATREFVKEEIEDKSVDAQEASAQHEIGSKEIEAQKAEENVKKIEQDEETEELRPDVEMEKREQNGLDQDQHKDESTSVETITFEGGLQEKNHHSEGEDNEHKVVKAKGSIEEDTDVCVSAQTTLVEESIKNEETISEKAIEKEVCEENVPKKAEFEGGLDISDSMAPSQKETPKMLEKDQGDGDGVTSSQEALAVDVEETTTVQHVTTVSDFKEQNLNEKPKEFIEDKSVDAQKASEEGEKEAKEDIDIEQNPEESVKKIEKEVETEEIKPGVEIEEKKEQNELLPAITTDVCISTQTKSQVDKTEQEEQDKQNEGGLNEKSDSPSIKEVCEETGSEKVEYEEEVKPPAMTTMNKDEEKKQAVDMLEKVEGEDDITSSQEVTFEKDLQETNQHNEDDASEVVTDEESVKKTEQQMLTKSIPSDVCISTQTGPEEETTEKNDEEAEDKSVDAQKETGQYADGANDEREQKLEESVDETAQSFSKNDQEEDTEKIESSDEKIEEKNVCISEQIESQEEATKNEENATKSDGDQKEKTDNPFVKEVCENHDLKKSESEEERQLPDSSNVNTRESVQEDAEEIKSSDETKENMQQHDEIKTSEVQGVGDDFTSSQNASSEDIKETIIHQHDATVAHVEEGQSVSATSKEILIEEEDKSSDAEEISSEPKKQNVEETHSKTTNENSEDETKKEDKDLSHESVEDITDNSTKEENFTSEHDHVQEHGDRDEVAIEEVINLNETTKLEPKEDIRHSTSLETSTEDASNSEKEKAESENLPIEDLETVSEVNIPDLVPKSEESVLKEEHVVSETETHLDEENVTVKNEISSDEKTEHTTEIYQETVKEVCEETSSEKTKLEEGSQLSDSSNTKINEKEVTTFKDDNQVNVSGEIQGDDNITSSQNAVSAGNEDLKEKNCHNEGNEGDFIKSGDAKDEDTEEIISSVETKENIEHVIATNVCNSTQMENNEETIENEEKDSEKATEYDENETASREENLEKKQNDVEEVQGKEEGDKSVVAQKESENYDDGENNESEEKPEEHTNEIKPSVETNDEKGVCISKDTKTQEEATKNEENVTKNDDDREEKSDNPFDKEVCEGNDLKKLDSEEERELSDSSNVKTRESADDDTEENNSNDERKENIEQQGLLHAITTDVCSSTQPEHTEKNTESEENNAEETIENDDDQKEKPESPSVEVVCEATSSEIIEPEEGLKHSDSSSTTPNENETEGKEENLEKEDEIETSEVQGGEDDVTSSQNASIEDIKETTIQHDTTVAYVEEGKGVIAMPKEILIEEAEDKSIDAEEVSLELGQPKEQNVEETHPSGTVSETPEDVIKKEDRDILHESVETGDDTNTEEKTTLQQEPVEEHSDRDEVSKEKFSALNETSEVEPKEDITPSTLLQTSTKDTSNSEENAESEKLPIVSEVHIPELVPKSEESVQKEECFISKPETHLDEENETVIKEISSDEKTEQTSEIKQETVKEVCEETSSENAELEEGLKQSNGSDTKINEKGMATIKDEDQEKDQEGNVSAENQGEDNITSSQNDVYEEKEDLQEKNYQNESHEHIIINSRDDIHEDAEEAKSSVEMEENTERVTTTDVRSSTQVESHETTIENEEKNGEKSIEIDENETASQGENLKKKQDDVCSSVQTERKEETVENEATKEEAIENDDGQKNLEKREKEQELEISELQGCGDDVISSQTASNEGTKETTIDQHATTMVHFEEEPSVTAITKEIVEEEIEGKSVHSQEANEQSEKGAKDETKQQPEESVNKPANTCSETIEESIKEEEADAVKKEIESELEAENQAILTENVPKELGQLEEQKAEEIQMCPTETISENTKDEITTKDVDSSNYGIEHAKESITKEEKCIPDGNTKETEISTLEHEPVEQNDSQDEVSKEKVTDLNETIAVEPQVDVRPSGSLGTPTEDALNSVTTKAESENLPIEDLESVSEVHIPEVMPKSEDSKMKEESLISSTATYVNEENEAATKETSSYENLEAPRSTQQSDNSNNTTEEKSTQVEQTGEINSIHENRNMKEDVTQESQLNTIEDCSQMVKDVSLTEEIEQMPLKIEKEKEINDLKEQTIEKDSYSKELEEKSIQNQKEIGHEISNSDSKPVENAEVTEVNVDGQLGQEDLQGKEDISCVSKDTNDSIDQEPKEETIPSLEDGATVESQVNVSNIESTASPSETEKLVTQALESDRDVQIPEVVAYSEESKVKEECTVLEADEFTDEKNAEHNTKTNEISSAPDKEPENVTEAPTNMDETKSSDLIMEEKALTKENLEVHELKPTSEPAIEDQVTIETKPQPEQSDIRTENITGDRTLESKLEHTRGKDLEDGKENIEEDVTLAPENEIKKENQNETTKNIILTDEVAVETEKEKEKNETKEQVLEEDNCPTELGNTSTPNQKELVDENDYSKPIPVGNTEVTEVKAESQIDVKNIQAAEDLRSSSKASSIIETSKAEMHEGTEQSITVIGELKDDSTNEASKDKTVPVVEDSKASELQLNSRLTDREILEEKDDEEKSELQISSEYQKNINERCIEEDVHTGEEVKDAKSENKAVKDVIKNEVLLEDEKAKESKSIKDSINEEAKLNQLTSDTDEVCQSKSPSSRPDELETKHSVEDIGGAKVIAANLNVKDETSTVMKEPTEDSEIVASEFKSLEDTVTEKEKETLDEPRVDDSAKTTYDSILRSTEKDVEARSEEIRGDGDMLKLEEKPTKDSKIVTEVAEIVPEHREAFADLVEDKNTEDPEILPSVEKEFTNIQKHEKDPDHETEVKIADVASNVECSETEPPHLDTKETTSEFINQEIQREQKKEADESIEAVIPVEDVKTAIRESEVRNVDLEAPSVMDATAEKAKNKTVEDGVHLESKGDQSKLIDKVSEMKQEPSELDAPGTLGTVAATEDFKISQKSVTDDLIKISQTHPEIQKYEAPAGTVDKQSSNEPHQRESTDSKILTQKIESSHEQAESIAKSLIPEAANSKDNNASGTEPQCSDTTFIDQKKKSELQEPAKIYLAGVLHKPAKEDSEVAENLVGEKDSALTKDQQPGKIEVGESGVKTDEEDDEDEDNENDEKMGSCSDAPVMVEASKDMDVKVHKKSHNILSGVGSKVKHSIAKVKKAITGKTSPTKSPSPKAKNQVAG